METSPNTQKRSITVLLRCPGIHEAPTVVTAVVEDAVIDTMLNGEDVTEWDVRAMRSANLEERLWDDHGEIILAAHGEELWNFYKDPRGMQREYQDQIDSLVDSFITLNKEVFQVLYDSFIITDLNVIRAFKNQWMLLASVKEIDKPKV